MKLATLKSGKPDGTLVVVSCNLERAVSAECIAGSLREALEQWNHCAPELQLLAGGLESGNAKDSFPFDPKQAAAPLPRAAQFLDGSVYRPHVRRIVEAFNLSRKALEIDFPMMYQGASDAFLGPHTDMPLPNEEDGIDIEAELGVITGTVPMGASPDRSGEQVRLLIMFDDVTLRGIIFKEMALGFGMIQSKPSCVFAPVAVTPDELGTAWHDNRLHMRMQVHINGRMLGDLATGDMGFNFAQLMAHAARTRTLTAGTIIGSGTVANEEESSGVGCIAERRALEILASGVAKTDWLKFGYRIRIDVRDANGHSVFGAIDHGFLQTSSS